VKHWHTCIERGGDYVEKWRSVLNPICTYSVSKKLLRLLFDSSSYVERLPLLRRRLAPLNTFAQSKC
jgi:hypothetical protein